ncbi:MAG: hypothetical protein ACOY3E_03340 [Pseudomonadota bacterium]
MKRFRLGGAVLILLALFSACTSIPLSTMWKMRNFDEQQFAELNGEEIRVRVRLPAPSKLNVAETSLESTLETEQGRHSTQLTLEQESLRSYSVSEGLLFKEDVTYSEYVLRLSAGSLQRFATLQRLTPTRSQTQKSAFKITTDFTNLPEGLDSLQFSVDLQLKRDEGYFALLDKASISFKSE